MKKDEYSQSRGGWSRNLDISCEGCGEHVCFYQKDGPGPMKRMYLDRISDYSPDAEIFKCKNCNRELGLKIVYEKENRPAYRLFQDSVSKKIVKQRLSENK